MRKRNVFLVFFLSCVLFISCEKSVKEKDIIGKWKLHGVEFDKYLSGIYYEDEFDIENYNVIYDFQKNNKLVVTSTISGVLHKNEYSYKCEKSTSHPLAYGTDSKRSRSLNLYIDGILCCWCIPLEESMWMAGYINKMTKPIDEIDLLMAEAGIFYLEKEFNKLKE